jgi:hypothetical protein
VLSLAFSPMLPPSPWLVSVVAPLKRHVCTHTDKSVTHPYPELPNTAYSHTGQCAWPCTSHPHVTRMGRAGRTYPTLLPLLATTPLTVGAFVRVPHLTIALIPLQQSVVYSTEWAVLICRLSHTLRWWLRRWLRWNPDAEPLARLLDLRLDASEVHPAQSHHGFMAVQGGFQRDRHRHFRQRRCGSVRLRWWRLAA